jgi:hypothetical protein
MNLLKEIDERAKVEEFRLFLEDLKELSAAENDESVLTCIREKMEILQEIGRGDFDTHMAMAQGAGHRGLNADPAVVNKLQPKRRLGLQEPSDITPEQGQLVRFKGQTYRLGDTNGKIAYLEDPKNASPFGGQQIKINVADLKPIKTKSGKMAWVHMGEMQ